MKIVDVAEFYAPQGGGVRTYIDQKLEAAREAGIEVVVIAPGAESREERRPGGKIVWVEAPPIPVDRRYRMFWKAAPVAAAVLRENPSILEGSSPWRGGWIVRDLPIDVPKILFMHADPVAIYPYQWFGRYLDKPKIDAMFSWFWSYLRRLSEPFDNTVVAGQWLAARFGHYGLHNLVAAEFGVDKSLFSPARRSAELRRELLSRCGLPEDATLLATVGRLHPEKKHELILRAFARAQSRRPVGLIIIGDGLARDRIERMAASVPHVVLLGRIEDRERIAAVMASVDIVMHASESETFGLVLAEALAAGTPIVVPDAGGAAAFADERFGEVFKAGDVAAASAALERCLARDLGALRRDVITGAAARIREDGDHFATLFALYRGLIEKRRGPAASIAPSR